MRRKFARILLPRAPACAPCEPHGSVWRDPAVASASRVHRASPGSQRGMEGLMKRKIKERKSEEQTQLWFNLGALRHAVGMYLGREEDEFICIESLTRRERERERERETFIDNQIDD